jgi:MFS family permease
MLVAVVPTLLRQFAPNLLLSFPAIFGLVGGLEFGVLFIPAFTVLQEHTEAELRGRIFGAVFTVVNAAVAVPILLAGGLADLFGVSRVIFGMGVLLVLAGLTSALPSRRSPLIPPKDLKEKR